MMRFARLACVFVASTAVSVLTACGGLTAQTKVERRGEGGSESGSEEEAEGEIASEPAEVSGAYLAGCNVAGRDEQSGEDVVGCVVIDKSSAEAVPERPRRMQVKLVFGEVEEVHEATAPGAGAYERFHGIFRLGAGRWRSARSVSVVVQFDAVTYKIEANEVDSYYATGFVDSTVDTSVNVGANAIEAAQQIAPRSFGDSFLIASNIYLNTTGATGTTFEVTALANALADSNSAAAEGKVLALLASAPAQAYLVTRKRAELWGAAGTDAIDQAAWDKDPTYVLAQILYDSRAATYLGGDAALRSYVVGDQTSQKTTIGSLIIVRPTRSDLESLLFEADAVAREIGRARAELILSWTASVGSLDVAAALPEVVSLAQNYVSRGLGAWSHQVRADILLSKEYQDAFFK